MKNVTNLILRKEWCNKADDAEKHVHSNVDSPELGLIMRSDGREYHFPSPHCIEWRKYGIKKLRKLIYIYCCVVWYLVISTECALRRPITYDNHPIPVLSRFVDLLNSLIYDLKRSVGLKMIVWWSCFLLTLFRQNVRCWEKVNSLEKAVLIK